jgi:hypothetical protein
LNWEEMRLAYLVTLLVIYISIVVAPTVHLIARLCTKK